MKIANGKWKVFLDFGFLVFFLAPLIAYLGKSGSWWQHRDRRKKIQMNAIRKHAKYTTFFLVFIIEVLRRILL